MLSAADERWMRAALQLAARGRGRTSPNPAVGCVVVAGGAVVGQGFHPRAGEPHAEVFALDAAGERARGATLYVTLEPCCHHGRTPPCTERILAAGVARVVAAMTDPDPRVSGGGVERLRAAGVEVEVGCLEAEARELNAPYVTARTLGRPFFLLKYAMTLDGRLHAASGDARWVSGEESRRRAHGLRDWMDAVLVGAGTVLADDPQLTCRIPGGRDPLRVIADTRARTPASARALGRGCLVAVGPDAPAAAVRAMERTGAEVVRLPTGEGGHIDLRALAAELLGRGALGVLAEGGPTLLAALADAGLCDRVVCFLAPKLIGGKATMGEALEADRLDGEPAGEDWMLTARGPFGVHGAG
jgi:diaminohydroxyphosphoribosylaminopyrimidine deaminase/5-amino-6-(5-phosphoribosylamino)uracil reductase